MDESINLHYRELIKCNTSYCIFLCSIFKICNSVIPGGSYVASTVPRGGIALPGLTSSRDEGQYCWSDRLNKQNMKWREGRSPCERPRTYDKFYQKTPGNFQAPVSDGL